MRHKMLCDITLFRFLKRGILPGAILLFVINAAISPLYSGDDKKKEAPAKKETKVTAEAKKGKKEETKKEKPPGGEFKEEDFKPKVEEGSYAWDIFKAFLIVGILVGVFYYFFRYVTQKAGIQVMGEDVIKILAVSPVGQNRYIQVIDLAGKILVVGITDGSINLISEITDRDEIDRIRLLGSQGAPAVEGGFQELIRKQVGKLVDRIQEKSSSRKPQVTEFTKDDEGDLDYLRQQKDRLKNLNGNSHE